MECGMDRRVYGAYYDFLLQSGRLTWHRNKKALQRRSKNLQDYWILDKYVPEDCLYDKYGIFK
jgi:hypothetical protein